MSLVGAGMVLLVTLGIGLVAHELSHAMTLRAFGIPHTIEWFPGRQASSQLAAGITGVWATVTPRQLPQDTPSWRLRLSALAPIVLLVPFLAIPFGLVPDPLRMGEPMLAALTIGWFACALPSPADFSLFWHADRAIEEHGTGR